LEQNLLSADRPFMCNTDTSDQSVSKNHKLHLSSKSYSFLRATA